MKSIYFENTTTMINILGSNDSNLSYLEILLSCELLVKGNQLISLSDNENFIPFINHLISKNIKYNENELFLEFTSFKNGMVLNKEAFIVNERSVFAKTRNQNDYINHLINDKIIFAIGPAGSGKTYLAIAYALSQVLSGKKKKIILTRPVVEAGESLGYLPGDLAQKLNPYLKPLYDAMESFISPLHIKKFEDNKVIEISPLAYMRGRSINNAIIILDEAQNTTKTQIKMFLTRLGEDSKAIITGDLSQVDLKSKDENGLSHASKLLSNVESLSIIYFNSSDIVRSKIVKEIIKLYNESENYEN